MWSSSEGYALEGVHVIVVQEEVVVIVGSPPGLRAGEPEVVAGHVGLHGCDDEVHGALEHGAR